MRKAALVVLGVAGCHTGADGTATVEIDREQPAGVEVFFQSRDSSLLARVTTDANGVAVGPMNEGGFVTLVDPFGHDEAIGAQLYTYLDAQPGDGFVLRAPPARDLVASATAVLSFPASTDSSVTNYQVFAAGCAVGGYPHTVVEDVVTKQVSLRYCEATVDLLVMASRDTMKVQWAFAEDQIVADTLDLGALTWSPFAPQTMQFDNLSSYDQPNASSTMATKRGAIFGSSLVPDGRVQTTEMPLVPGATNQIRLITYSSTEAMQSHLVENGPFKAVFQLDAGARLAGVTTSCPVYVRDTRTLTWSEMGGGAPLDFVTATIDVAPRDAAPWTWRVLAPARGVELVLPAFPDELAAFQIEGLDFYAVHELLRGTATGGYPGLRALGIWPALDRDGYQLNGLAELGSFMLAQTPGCRPL